MNLTDINEIKALLARHGFRFSKSLGQNFLCAAWVPERIAEGSGADGATGVLEVGAGVGCLTVELAARAKRVVCVELDTSLKPVLAETLADCPNVEVVYGDVMKTDLPALVKEKFSDCERVIVCANLPYNITTPVLTAFVEAGCFASVTVMIQKEVARRVCAREGTADYGAFTVLMQWHTRPEILFDVSPGCFIPAPKVTSSVVRMERRVEPPCAVRDEGLLFALVRAAFNQRRKTLVNALANGLGGRFDKERLTAALAACGLDERVRGEALSIGQFAALADALTEGET
ncbi:MAG: 16S rRNA (adenine(1518)-N(6)/adenine(1519)-N(6))-dimethyltransferase RsmA [Oscillospiraceae bacterium]